MTTTKAVLATVLRVRDIMNARVVHVDAGSTLQQTSEVLSANRIGGAPVLNGSQIVGVVSKSDLVNRMFAAEDSVEKVMTRVYYAVRANDPVSLAVRLMVDEEIHRVLAVDDQANLVGIITSTDVLRALRDGRPGLTTDSQVELTYVDLRNR